MGSGPMWAIGGFEVYGGFWGYAPQGVWEGIDCAGYGAAVRSMVAIGSRDSGQWRARGPGAWGPMGSGGPVHMAAHGCRTLCLSAGSLSPRHLFEKRSQGRCCGASEQPSCICHFQEAKYLCVPLSFSFSLYI